MKRALIFGASGQAGYYLGKFLERKDYEVYRVVRRLTEEQTSLRIWGCSLMRPYDVNRVITSVDPDEVYNLAAMMFAPASWEHPGEYLQINALAVGYMLETLYKINPKAKFFQAGSAEIFDQVYPLSEDSPVRPRNPYGISKATAQELVRVYREQKGMFACTGILFNMESPRRPDTFFSVKVAKAVARMAAGLQDKLELGQLHAVRDWGLAEEYVEAMWLMLQASKPQDYVIGTGLARSCLKFVETAFTHAGLSIDRLVYDKSAPDHEDILWSDPRKIYQDLGWQAKSLFSDVVRTLVEAEMAKLEAGVKI